MRGHEARGMRLGYSITSFQPAGGAAAGADAIIDRAAAATAAGYDYVQAGDHHAVADGDYLQNVPMAARLAAETDHVAALFMLPLYDPVLIAEQVGTLDALVDELDFWCAVGGQTVAFEAFGIPMAERAPRFEESLSLIRQLWTEDAVTFAGEWYTVEDVSVNPAADPRVVIGGIAEPAVRRAGQLGHAWVATPSENHDALARKIGWFEDAGGGDVVVRRDALVLDDRDAARERASALLESGYRGWPADADWPLVGDPAAVAEDLASLSALGVDEVVVRPMDDEHATETLRGVAGAREQV